MGDLESCQNEVDRGRRDLESGEDSEADPSCNTAHCAQSKLENKSHFLSFSYAVNRLIYHMLHFSVGESNEDKNLNNLKVDLLSK